MTVQSCDSLILFNKFASLKMYKGQPVNMYVNMLILEEVREICGKYGIVDITNGGRIENEDIKWIIKRNEKKSLWLYQS